ncbi:MAG: hypothetical protein LBD29_04035 [Treponema sp.]|jgi:hypothetical protein|nr:hypothetical protein [Treponema sp.]
MKAARANEEYHDLLDDLAERRFFGEVTFFFQGGNIESNRMSERNTKSEVREKMKSRKRQKFLKTLTGRTNG